MSPAAPGGPKAFCLLSGLETWGLLGRVKGPPYRWTRDRYVAGPQKPECNLAGEGLCCLLPLQDRKKKDPTQGLGLLASGQFGLSLPLVIKYMWVWGVPHVKKARFRSHSGLHVLLVLVRVPHSNRGGRRGGGTYISGRSRAVCEPRARTEDYR